MISERPDWVPAAELEYSQGLDKVGSILKPGFTRGSEPTECSHETTQQTSVPRTVAPAESFKSPTSQAWVSTLPPQAKSSTAPCPPGARIYDAENSVWLMPCRLGDQPLSPASASQGHQARRVGLVLGLPRVQAGTTGQLRMKNAAS